MIVQSFVKYQMLLIVMSCRKILQQYTPGLKGGSFPWISASAKSFVSLTKGNPAPTYTYHVNNVMLQWVDSFRVRINSKLKWDEQVLSKTDSTQDHNILSYYILIYLFVHSCTPSPNLFAHQQQSRCTYLIFHARIIGVQYYGLVSSQFCWEPAHPTSTLSLSWL